MEKIIKAVAKFAAKEGLGSFLLLARNGPMVTMHLENTNIQSAMQMVVVSFHQIINMELERHPEHSKEYKDLYLQLASDFNDLIRAYDKKFINFNGPKNKEK